MKDASQYPVTTPFGQVPGYPLNNGFHNGIDYGCPTGTSVLVNGFKIATSNNTGATTGPHLHVGKYVNGVVQDPGVGNGFKFTSAVVYDTGYDPTNGNYVRVMGDGALWNYLHLQTILVTKGQILKGDNMAPPIALLTQKQVLDNFHAYGIKGDGPGGEPTQKQLDNYSTENPAVMYNDFVIYLHNEVQQLQSQADFVPVTDQLYEKKG